ncbi:maleylpyruvate isomerase N-terminal domain-containing protein [Siphonobacter sp. SORGH_AS_1065]|uniref:maleylpyruvate isomerase N-terminal domain-containing protein n=1 Tax=Siphonobacter sp. SORGH_AS_1065 TaxID=3041795 RepID=UPI002782E222|nr:maleylpyruvate isomerase N-terminal domain-containing protein [Siphonobacter sp. SORGH_AS_1065]MDQ1086338.1 hypothetical protein [Siphonobacter sp. SORGH_AS_1065]
MSTIQTTDFILKIRTLDQMLFDLLRSLNSEEWQAQTIAKRWKVKDVVAHLLDGNIRILSQLRDGYQGENPSIHSYQDLLDYLNGLNADWVQAMKRVSPPLLILLHELTGPLYCDYYATLDPEAPATFSVAWAGEEESKNWMHLAREYTEKWLHQQQIRAAVHKPGLLTKEFFYPFIDTFMYALPHTYRSIQAENGTTIQLTITSEIGGSWYVVRENNAWILKKEYIGNPTSEVSLSPETAWPLFSKSIWPQEIMHQVMIRGDQKLGRVALEMVSVMA